MHHGIHSRQDALAMINTATQNLSCCPPEQRGFNLDLLHLGQAALKHFDQAPESLLGPQPRKPRSPIEDLSDII